MDRTALIQCLIDKVKATSYLEIGVCGGLNFEKIRCKNKVGVDPSLDSKATLFMSSDEFFSQNSSKFDVIFVDGLHHSDQVLKDILNSLSVLKDGGYIICHDMNPLKEEHQEVPFKGGTWNGDCWKAFVKLRQTRDDLEMNVVDIDYGCGVIKKGTQALLKVEEDLNYRGLEKHRNEWLNLISWEEFLESYVKVSFKSLLNEFIFDTNNPDLNYDLGMYYDSIGQTASAVSFFLRCAERSKVPEIQYECLIRAASCFEKQGKRNFTVRGLLQHAIGILPKRPEAYYLLSRFYEREKRDGSWQDSYMIASIGEKVADFNSAHLRNTLDYPGPYAITFQKGVAAWWCGLCQESRDIFLHILHDCTSVSQEFINSCISNLLLMKTKPFTNYSSEDYDKLTIKFKGSETIKENHSEAYQDLFVLTVLDGKQNGTYLEIGSGDPYYGNNTALLESVFGWKGVALDSDENLVNSYNSSRINKCFCGDARKVDYRELLSKLCPNKEVDYLQIDCNPLYVTYQVLLSIPFEEYKFAVVTYEHDDYRDPTKSFQSRSSEHLKKHGYMKIVNNASPDNHRGYEDWWVHPELVKRGSYERIFDLSRRPKNARKIFIEG